jgi:uncharacterized protein
MRDWSPVQVTEMVFSRVRKHFQLGLNELRDALNAAQVDRFGCGNPDDLKAVLQLIWCHSPLDQDKFGQAWEAVQQELAAIAPEVVRETDETPIDDRWEPPTPSTASRSPAPAPTVNASEPPIANQLSVLPLQAPPILPTDGDDEWENRSYFPVDRRSLSYGWQYLRRMRADGPMDVLDEVATVNQAARQGFFLAPEYQRRAVNHARLMILIDQQGSMVPFHRYSRDVAQTAQADGVLAEVGIYYFRNVPGDFVFEDEHLTQPQALADVFEQCDRDTSVLVVSDAGAARGTRQMQRLRATIQFLARLKQHTEWISWLNPMPKSRWWGTSAEMLAGVVPMAAMDPAGFEAAIGDLRGLVLPADLDLNGEGER